MVARTRSKKCRLIVYLPSRSKIFLLQTNCCMLIYEEVSNNKNFLFALLLVAYICMPSYVIADDTCCVGHGGDNSCNVSTQQLYCQDGTVSTQCTCHAAPTPTPTIMPTDTPIVSQAPECPANASFSSSNNACTCSSGYVVSNNSCVSYARYCQAQYGNNANYDSGSNVCACVSGYTWNTSRTSCVTMDALCNEKIGSKSYYNSADTSCYCYNGYAIQNGQCQVVPTPLPPATIAPTTGVQLIQSTPAPMPTLAGVIIPTRAPTKTPIKKPATFNLKKKVPGLNGYIAVKKKQGGFFEDLFSAIVQALMKAFNI